MLRVQTSMKNFRLLTTTIICVLALTTVFISMKTKTNTGSQNIDHKDKIRYKHPTRKN